MDAISALQKFLEAWQQRDWAAMYSLSQKTWATRNDAAVLAGYFGKKDLERWSIGDAEMARPTVFRLPMTLTFKLDGQSFEVSASAMVLCEAGPYQPNPDGQWGINPISMLRQTVMDRAEVG